MESMISNVFINNDSDKIEELMVMIKLLSLSVPHNDSDGDGNEASIRVLLCVLSSCKGKTLSSPYTVLEAVTSIVTSSSSLSLLSSYNLQHQEAESLRNLIVQCLHGGAPESVRYGTLSCIQDLFLLSSTSSSSSPTSSSSLLLSLSWTIEEKGNNIGQFAMLLCSIVRGEFHLLLQELITLHSYNNNDNDNDNNNQLKYNISIERKERLMSMIYICCSLMESFLHLLIGKTDDDDNDDDDDSDDETNFPLWSSLSSNCLLYMSESFHNVCQDIFDFIDIVANNTTNTYNNNNDIIKILCRLLEMINIMAIEDEDVIKKSIKYNPSIDKIIDIMINNNNNNNNNNDNKDDIKNLEKIIKVYKSNL